jgi:hypothetical protein
MLKIATPISHLFLKKKDAKNIIKYSDCLEIREKNLFLNYKNENLFHLDHDIIHPWTNSFKKNLKKILIKKNNIKLITFQATRCCEGRSVKNGKFQLSGDAFSRDQMLKFAKKNIFWLKKNLKKEIKIGIENNNYYSSMPYKHVTDAKFIKKIVEENKIFFLLDVAHAMITAYNRKINFIRYLYSLPLKQTIQLHICCPSNDNKNNILIDSHLRPNKRMLNLVIKILKKFKQIEYLTIEYYRDAKILIRSIVALRKAINDHGL